MTIYNYFLSTAVLVLLFHFSGLPETWEFSSLMIFLPSKTGCVWEVRGVCQGTFSSGWLCFPLPRLQQSANFSLSHLFRPQGKSE